MRGIDFIVFGVPRSGTSALSNVLNLHKNVCCFREFFKGNYDHGKIIFPDTFYNRSVSKISSFQGNKRLLKQKQDNRIRTIGNKQPYYYLNLREISKHVQKGILIIRDPLGVASSWNGRAKKAHLGRDAFWDAGQVGIFGILDYLTCLDNCSRINLNLLVINYNKLFFDDDAYQDTITKIFNFLEVGIAQFDQNEFAKNFLNNKAIASKKRQFERIEEEFLQLIKLKEFQEELFNQQQGAFFFNEQSKVVLSYLDSLATSNLDIIEFLFDNLLSYGKPECFEYFLKWLSQRINKAPEFKSSILKSMIGGWGSKFVHSIELSQENRLPQAIGTVKNIIKQGTKDYDYMHYHLASLLNADGKLRAAEKEIQTALQINSGIPSYYQLLSDVLSKQQQLPEAIIAAEKAVELNKNSSSSHYNLANLLMANGELEAAEKEIKAALQINNNVPSYYKLLSVILNKQGKLSQAIVAAKKAVEQKLNDPKSHFRLAKLLTSNGELGAAQLEIQKALEIKPRMKQYKQLLNHIVNAVESKGRLPK